MRVLADKFKWPPERIAQGFNPLWDFAHFVTPRGSISASRDETDNRILECGVEAGAEVIVTYDKDLLCLSPFKGIRIMKARAFLELLGA